MAPKRFEDGFIPILQRKWITKIIQMVWVWQYKRLRLRLHVNKVHVFLRVVLVVFWSSLKYSFLYFLYVARFQTTCNTQAQYLITKTAEGIFQSQALYLICGVFGSFFSDIGFYFIFPHMYMQQTFTRWSFPLSGLWPKRSTSLPWGASN